MEKISTRIQLVCKTSNMEIWPHLLFSFQTSWSTTSSGHDLFFQFIFSCDLSVKCPLSDLHSDPSDYIWEYYTATWWTKLQAICRPLYVCVCARMCAQLSGCFSPLSPSAELYITSQCVCVCACVLAELQWHTSDTTVSTQGHTNTDPQLPSLTFSKNYSLIFLSLYCQTLIFCCDHMKHSCCLGGDYVNHSSKKDT